MINFLMIASGSRGNSTLIWDEDDLIIIDAGISLRKFRTKLHHLILMIWKNLYLSAMSIPTMPQGPKPFLKI